MSGAMISRRETIIFEITAFVVLAASAVVGFMQTPSPTVRGVMVVVLAIIGIIQTQAPGEGSPTWRIHLYLGVQGTLVAVLLFLVPGWTMFPTLYCLLSVQAILFLSPNPGVLWIAAYVLVTAASLALRVAWKEGPIALVLYGAINGFFGAYANALLRANAAHHESQGLLAELRQAHEQLQEYALRAEELAVVEERTRLAREMHDTVGHCLTVASVQLEAAQRLCPTDAERAASLVGTVREQVRQALGELRGTVAALRVPVEAELQLRSSLRRMIANFEAATNLSVHWVLPEDMPPLPSTYRLALYRAAQEALTNIQKHAGAKHVWLLLTVSDGLATLLVSDDGQGLGYGQELAGFGLLGLRERAEQLGGDLHLEPRPGGGAQLSFRLPLPEKAQGEDG